MIDSAQLSAALALLVAGFPFEVRILGGMDRPGGKPMTFSGYFDDVHAVEPALRRIRGGWHGVYVTANPVDSALLHRCYNRIEVAQRNATTSDAQITRRRWLLADLDPVTVGDNGPIKGIAATDAEKAHALALAQTIRAAMFARGWPAPVMGDSGNGAHLMWRVDLPAVSDLPKRWLDALAVVFAEQAGETVMVDTSVGTAARIWKLYGTLACKGAGVGDRPHRYAQLLDVPAAVDVVPAELIEAFIAEVSPAAPAPAAAMTATRAPAAAIQAGEFDAVALCESAGLSLGPPKVRSGGDTVRECTGTCPCGKLSGNEARGSYLVVAANGAVGMGCRHASCDFSDTNRKPGESWKAWRRDHDPAYDPDGMATATATVARGDTIAERLRRSPGAVDLSGFVPEFAPAHAESAAPAPRRARGAGTDSRGLIDVAVDHSDLKTAVLSALSGDRTLYLSQGDLSRIDDGYRMQILDEGALDAVTAGRCKFVIFKLDRETSAYVPRPQPLPPRVLRMLQSLLPEDYAHFRQVSQITRAPFFTSSGQLVASPGYNAEAQTLLVECPPVQSSAFPDGTFAIEFLRSIVKDFPFEGGAYGSEFSNWLGALIAPMCRPMIRGPMPLLLIDANRPGTGKTLLAQLIQVIYGLPSEVGPMQREEGAFAKQLFSILRESKPVHVFDNVKHAVVSQSLDMVLTSPTYTDRLLGESKSLHLTVLTLWIMTSNNAKLSQDMVRRIIRCRLRTDLENPEERTDVERPDLLSWAADNRAEILGAMTQIVGEWIAAGAPLADNLPRLGSFESFASVIGSILAFHGDRQWLGNLRAAKAETVVDDEWEPFLASWFAAASTFPRAFKSKELHELCTQNGLLGSILAAGSDLSQMSRLARCLRDRRDQILYGFLITTEKDAHTSQTCFRVSRVPVARAAV